jgi:hypothetical protein
MKRTLLAFGIVIAGFQGIHAQQVTKTTVTIDKVPQTAQTVSFQEQETVVEDAIESIIKKNDGKVKTSKGYIIGRKVKMNELSDQKLDVYFKVDAEGRKKNQTSIVSMAVKQADGTFVSDSSNADLQLRANIFLTGFQQRVLVYKKDTEIAELQATLKKLNKSLANDKKDHQDNMTKKMKQMKEIETKLSALTGN